MSRVQYDSAEPARDHESGIVYAPLTNLLVAMDSTQTISIHLSREDRIALARQLLENAA